MIQTIIKTGLKTLLSVAILCIFGIALLIFFVKFNHDSFEARKAKELILHYPLLVRFINLNEPGDARYEYINSSEPAVTVLLAFSPKISPHPDISQWIQNMVGQTIGRQAEIVVYNELSFDPADHLNDETLSAIRSNLRETFITADVYVVYAPFYLEVPTQIGTTIHRDTMFIFKSQFPYVTTNQSLLGQLEHSTIKHEWGHLLGLDHVDSPQCIMYEKVEQLDGSFLRSYQIPTAYCREELFMLEAIVDR